MKHISWYFILAFALLFSMSCNQDASKQQKTNATNKTNETPKKDSLVSPKFTIPDWAAGVNIYEVNIRQYTKEGTFSAFEKHIPRLKEMGVDVLWLMPINPVSKKDRKGSLGSYYAVQDYKGVNPNFGTLDDLKSLVQSAHKAGMYVILDWVANHTGRDNLWITKNPEWYTKDAEGNIAVPEGTDWTDVADLNYDNKDMRRAMIDALKYWIQEVDIDGYRCDVAGMVPIDFWIEARKEIETLKPVFMLAEEGKPEIHKAFDMSYGWDIHHIMNQVAKGEKTVSEIDKYFKEVKQKYQPEDVIMNFTSNHDENSWNGTVYERMGKAALTFAVFASSIPGMPLIYSGQEASLNKRLEFFEKDPINWKGKSLNDFYATLLKAKHEHAALWNGIAGGELQRIHTSNDEAVFAFVREKDKDKVFVVLNFSENEIEIEFLDPKFKGIYTEIFTKENVSLTSDTRMKLKPWDYKVFCK
ncbi:MAG: alpha-amylase [Bacteroidia bacterium]|nr:MAG: alpha-amylase [Bacteroidia bacterium]PIE86437.1 MAG: alpha-amylase [Bacteroidia bacterium]